MHTTINKCDAMTKMIVTPWEVSGEIDYKKLIKQFGTEPITDKLLKRIEKITGDLHFMIRRKLFFSHRDLDWILNEYEKGNKFFLYTGRGPSGHTHLGHLVPWIFTKWLQEKFEAELYFQMTDDEKFLFNENLELEEANRFSYENALDVIALGFDEEKTYIFSDIDYAKTLYREAIKVAKKLTFSTTRAVFGFKNEDNVGKIFFTSMQSVPAFLPSIKKGKNIPCLIPHAIDQDPHFRISRDILPKLGFYKPAAIHCMFLPSLHGPGSKMSASDPYSAIFTTDPPDLARKKIMKAFSGGAGTLKEHKEKGGNPDIDVACQYLLYMFEEDDDKIKEIFSGYRNGSITSGEVKNILADKVEKFLKEHQKKREEAKKKLDKFILKD
ncbi:MAG: tryptophan--tRNA ligase [Candidatus Aenigmatarchaeota archaeon]